MLKTSGAVFAGGVAFALAAAGTAGAVTVTGAGFYPTAMVTYEGSIAGAPPGPFSRDTGPIQVNFGGSATPVWVYCIDWNHAIGAGLGYQLAVSYDYAAGSVTTDGTGGAPGTGVALTPFLSGEIQALVNLGVSQILSGSATDDQLAAAQAAIWDVEYNLTQNAGDATPDLIAAIQSDLLYAAANSTNSYASAIYSSTGQQGLAIATPEPAAWALMLVGFGAIGGALRGRRRSVAV